ncbi:RidA family protein [Streptomyces sp. NPDC056242]|uniref:RidA family protein n=1 Tax=unclassified Streptomyces TaxID=2593676 RepID=UPI0035DE4933
MTIQKINPETIAPPHGHAQVVVATGSKQVYISGQIAIDVDEKLLGEGDYETQGYHTVKNAYAAIAASGATPKDVVRLMVYVVDPTQENLEKLYSGLAKATAEAGGSTTAMTLIGVVGLSTPGALVEADMTAITD